MMSGTVAIVGRPNVGKSTLFNALTRTRAALVDDRPGVTRDRIYGKLVLQEAPEDTDDKTCLVVDTGGFEVKGAYYQPFAENIVWQQTEYAIEESDLILLVLDGKHGIHPHDTDLLRFLQQKNKPVLCVVNKIDTEDHEDRAFDFYQLGVDKLWLVSAAHRRGADELAEAIEQKLDVLRPASSVEGRVESPGARKVAIIGKPNAGKSSLLNRLTGETRSLVSDTPGTTRDSIDSVVKYFGHDYLLIDTAGIRRRARIKDSLENLTVLRAMQAVERADVVLLVIDATKNLTEQDARLADLATSQHKALIIVVNKWDLITNKDTKSTLSYEEDLRLWLKLQSFVPVLFISCLTNQRVHTLLSHVEKIYHQYHTRVETRRVNEALEEMVQEHTPALIRQVSRRVKFYYGTQVRSGPPTIVVFCNFAQEIQESYKRYMVKKFRDQLGFGDVPVRLLFRGRDENRDA